MVKTAAVTIEPGDQVSLEGVKVLDETDLSNLYGNIDQRLTIKSFFEL